VYLGRHGTLSILSLYLSTTHHVYLIDIHTLGTHAFTTRHPTNSLSLKTILESAITPKVFFDLRNDSDALYSLHQTSLAGVHDLQLMELATRPFSKRFLAGLAKCIRNCGTIPAAVRVEWQRSKELGACLFDPGRGGRYEVFNERPLNAEIIRYCARDVALLSELWREYSAKMKPPGLNVGMSNFWTDRVRVETEKRVRLSQSEGYNGHTAEMALGPW
jgi:exonuclease 3'-5' domain-containing protein 1